jgi:hypothetical protein
MAVVFQETFVGAISFNYYAGPRILFNFIARIGFVVEDSQVMSRRQSNLNTLSNQTTFEE